MEEAQARRERLKRMREQADGPAAAQGEPEAGAVLKFRNYTPASDKITHEKIEHAEPKQLEEPAPAARPDQAADDVEAVVNVAPKKPNWDLKRDIEGKLAKLERRTQRALVKLARQEEERRAAQAQG